MVILFQQSGLIKVAAKWTSLCVAGGNYQCLQHSCQAVFALFWLRKPLYLPIVVIVVSYWQWLRFAAQAWALAWALALLALLH